MLTLVEILIGIVVIVGVAAAICASPAAIILSPTSGDVVLAAKAAEMPLWGTDIRRQMGSGTADHHHSGSLHAADGNSGILSWL
jgi:C4-dicarboxylate transporter